MSYIKNGIDGSILASVERDQGPLMCNELIELWVSFWHNHIRVGLFKEYTNTFLEYEGPSTDKHINIIQMSSTTDAYWDFYQDQGMV